MLPFLCYIALRLIVDLIVSLYMSGECSTWAPFTRLTPDIYGHLRHHYPSSVWIQYV